jgi:hypothetical protein
MSSIPAWTDGPLRRPCRVGHDRDVARPGKACSAAGTPASISTLYADTAKALPMPDARDWFAAFAAERGGGTPNYWPLCACRARQAGIVQTVR